VAELTSVKTQARIAFTLQVLVLHDVLHEGSGGTQLDTFGGMRSAFPRRPCFQPLPPAPSASETFHEPAGRFVNWRWALVWITQILFYGLPWLMWNDRQAVLFDLGSRRFYIFGPLVLYPQDFIYLTALLIISGLCAVPVHCGGRPAVVRLCLPADGLHRDLHVDRAQVRRRPRGSA
jgi:hypothetical protein